MWNASETTRERGDNTLRQRRVAAHLLGYSLGEGLDNIRRSWKRLKRRLTEAVSWQMDDMYLSREWSHLNEVASFLYCDRTASSSTAELVDEICHLGIRTCQTNFLASSPIVGSNMTSGYVVYVEVDLLFFTRVISPLSEFMNDRVEQIMSPQGKKRRFGGGHERAHGECRTDASTHGPTSTSQRLGARPRPQLRRHAPGS